MDMLLPEHDGEIEKIFPLLTEENYRITSPLDVNYNCIAWAACIDHLWWQPDLTYNYFWPEGVLRKYTIEQYIEAYTTVGFEICDSDQFENEFEKLAIFVDQNGIPKHAARQLDHGIWTSKLGQSYDISHALHALDGEQYGFPKVFMKRLK
jgi:hypothetical protein